MISLIMIYRTHAMPTVKSKDRTIAEKLVSLMLLRYKNITGKIPSNKGCTIKDFKKFQIDFICRKFRKELQVKRVLARKILLWVRTGEVRPGC